MKTLTDADIQQRIAEALHYGGFSVPCPWWKEKSYEQCAMRKSHDSQARVITDYLMRVPA